jgi:hypothetical protein
MAVLNKTGVQAAQPLRSVRAVILLSVEEVGVETCLRYRKIQNSSRFQISKNNNILTHRRVEQKTRQ